jgi:hypothetical protein
MITLTVNGEKRELPAETDLVSFLGADVDVRLLSAYNGESSEGRTTPVRLREGDTEIAQGGG